MHNLHIFIAELWSLIKVSISFPFNSKQVLFMYWCCQDINKGCYALFAHVLQIDDP